MLNDKRPRLFALLEGWEILGYCEAPYPSIREYNDALVLEFDGRDNLDGEERGIYWMHCKLEQMNFISR
jgi:hypothetical protein